VAQNFAFSAYGPGAGTSASVSTVTAGAQLTGTRYAFIASGKCFIRFGVDASTNAATTDVWLATDVPLVFDILPTRNFVSFLSASGTVTVTYASVS
jgi:hypothetical protein